MHSRSVQGMVDPEFSPAMHFSAANCLQCMVPQLWHVLYIGVWQQGFDSCRQRQHYGVCGNCVCECVCMCVCVCAHVCACAWVCVCVVCVW